MQKITPFLWFDGTAEEAINLYVSIFKNSKILSMTRYGEGGPGPSGTVMSANFELEGQEFMALNGGPDFRFNPSISFYVHCEDQAEIDRLWNALLDGGEPQQCGWITDRFGVTWQIVPDVLETFLTDEDQAKVQRVTEAFLQMEKFDIPALEAAYAG